MGTKAGLQALEIAQLQGLDLECIIVATTTPDHVLPATATKIQTNLKQRKHSPFDVQAVCSGFVYALSVADSFIRSGQVKML